MGIISYLAASGGSSTDPAGVEQPSVGIVLLDLLRKHLGVAHRVQSQEGLGEARGEGGLRLRHSLLGTSHLRGVTRDEVIHGLLLAKLGDRGQDTASIAGEQHNVLGVLVGDAGDLCVLNVLDGVCATGVLSQGVVIVVDNTSCRVEDNVLQDGTETDGTENIGLLLSRQANSLGVATTLNVEDTLVAPAVFVVTDESTLGVGRKGGLAGTRQTKEDSDVSILALIRRGVQGKDVVLDGHLIEEHREDTFFHFSY